MNTNRCWKSIPRSSSSHREGSITQHGVSCGWYGQRQRRSTLKMMTWTYMAVKRKVSARYDGAVPITQEHITGTEFSLELSANVVHGEVELCVPTSLRRTRDKRWGRRQTAAVVTVVRKYPRELSCSNPPLSPQVHALVSTRWYVSANDDAHCVFDGVLCNCKM